jgi:hypothetical protein
MFDRPPLKQKSRRGCNAEDTSPAYIQRLRARYCDLFIKTGLLDERMGAELRAYADSVRRETDERRRANRLPESISAESDDRSQAPRRRGRAKHSMRTDVQIDDVCARRIGNFLRKDKLHNA